MRTGITNLVIYLILPANIIHSFIIDFDKNILISSGLILIVSLLLQIFCYFFSRFFYYKISDSRIAVVKYATLCSNAGFMGSPVIYEIYGDNGLRLASLFLIPQRIVMWTAGISCFTNNKDNIIKKVLIHPCIIAFFIGVFITVSNIQLPLFALQTIKSLSQCTTALSMIVIGSILSEISIKNVLSPLSIYYSLIRLIVIPLIVLMFYFLFHLPYLVTAVSVVLTEMPAGTTTAILAEKYKGDSILSVKLVFLSTLLSLVTIPLLSILVNYLFK